MASKADLPDIAARTLEEALRNIVDRGRKAVESPDLPDADAIHDLRRALKSWRAMLRLLGSVAADEAEAMRLEARDVAREAATARDSQAAREALADILDDGPGHGPTGVTAETRAAIEGQIDTLRAGAEASFSSERKAQISKMWRRAAAAIERWPLERFDCTEAATQLAASYRRARKAVPEDWSKAPPDALHKLRQRVVEHRHQMEIAEPLWPKMMRLWVSEAQKLRDRLGAHHDLEVLRRMTEDGQPLSQWRSWLAPLIAARQHAHAAAARRLAGRLFAETPRAFLHRLSTLWEHYGKH